MVTRRRILLGTTLSWLTLCSCQTALYLNTSPPGVLVIADNKEIGVTPLALSADKLPTEIAHGHLLGLEKAGYKKISIWIPAGIRGLDISLNMQPFEIRKGEIEELSDQSISRHDLYQLSWDLLRTQTSVFINKSEDPKLKALVAEFSSVGAVRYLAAVAEINKGNIEGGIKELKEAVKLSPKEADFLALLNEISKPKGEEKTK